MTEQPRVSFAAVQEHGSAAVAEIRQSLSELASLLGEGERTASDQMLHPAQRLVRSVAGFVEIAADPLAEFVERQRELADQMTAWAELQHQLADRMAQWADMQRQLAGAMAVWLAPASGAARVTTKVLHKVTKDQDDGGQPASGHERRARSAEHPAPKARAGAR